MREPEQPTRPPAADIDLSPVAAEASEESVASERESVGDLPDTGGLVPPDDAQ